MEIASKKDGCPGEAAAFAQQFPGVATDDVENHKTTKERKHDPKQRSSPQRTQRAQRTLVRKGSQAVKEDKQAPSIHAYLKETRGELVRQGVFEQSAAVTGERLSSGGPLGDSTENGRTR